MWEGNGADGEMRNYMQRHSGFSHLVRTSSHLGVFHISKERLQERQGGGVKAMKRNIKMCGIRRFISLLASLKSESSPCPTRTSMPSEMFLSFGLLLPQWRDEVTVSALPSSKLSRASPTRWI